MLLFLVFTLRGRKALQPFLQSIATALANVYDSGCKRLREKRQCTAGTDAVHCKGGCSALRERLQCTTSEMGKTGTEIISPILDKR